MRSYLIVANRTLSGAHLLEEVQARSAAEECRFHIVVPATPDAGRTNWTEGAAHAQAQRRLDEALEQFRAAGLELTGEVGDESPVRAVGDVLIREQFDAIIVSTLPPGVSKWLKRDLPHRLARRYPVPVIHLVGDTELVS
jgi:GABA permease